MTADPKEIVTLALRVAANLSERSDDDGWFRYEDCIVNIMEEVKDWPHSKLAMNWPD